MTVHKGQATSNGNLELLMAATRMQEHAREGAGRHTASTDVLPTPSVPELLATLVRHPDFAQIIAEAQGTQLGSTNLPTHLDPSHLQQNGASDSLFQQTRYGRISRPPVQPVDIPSLQDPTDAPGSMNTSTSQSSHAHRQPTRALPQASAAFGQITGGSQSRRESGRSSMESLSSNDYLRDLPAWPLPAAGPGARKKMPKEEMLARRRARNKESASVHRKNKLAKVAEVESRLKVTEKAYHELQTKCDALGRQVKELQAIIAQHGLPMLAPSDAPHPTTVPMSSTVQSLSTPFDPSMAQVDLSNFFANQTPATMPTQAINHASVGSSAMDTTLNQFDIYSFLDMDGEDDAEFLPPTSPHDSEDESRRKDKGKKRRREDEDDDEFVDEDVEDEDLFLPIEDVPIPPDTQVKSAMRSLGVDNQEELARLINQMVKAGKEGMTNETVDKLKVLVSLVGPNGTWAKDDKTGGSQ